MTYDGPLADELGRGRITRRTALTSIAALGIVGSGVVSAGDRSGSGEVLRRGTPDDPIDPAAIIDLQEDSFARHKRAGASVEPVVVEPGLDDSRDIVAYAHFVDDRGVMHSYVGSILPAGTVGSREVRGTEVTRRHRSAQAFLDDPRVVSTPSTSSDGFGVHVGVGIRHHHADSGTLRTTYDAFERGDAKFTLEESHHVIPAGATDSILADGSPRTRRDWDVSWLHDATVRECDAASVDTAFAVDYDAGAVGWTPDTPGVREGGSPSAGGHPFTWNGLLDESRVFQCVQIADADSCWGSGSPRITARRKLRFDGASGQPESFECTSRFDRRD